jgi:hypothetical protein
MLTSYDISNYSYENVFASHARHFSANSDQ